MTYERDQDANQVAPELGYTPRHLVKLARDKKVPATQRIKKWFFNVEELKIFLGMKAK